MPAFDLLDVSIDGGVARLTLDRPEKKNAINPTMADELTEALRAAEDAEVDVAVLTGEGDAFCAGMDLEERFLGPRRQGPEAYGDAGERTGRLFRTLADFSGPTVAKVNGWTFGGGFELQALCDFAVADEEAVFGLSEINFGYFPGGGTMWTAVHTMGRRAAQYYTATGETFTGAEAAEVGAVSRAVPEADLEATVEGLIETLQEKNSLALAYNKQVLERVRFMTFEEAQEYERAKAEEMKYYQRDEWATEGIGQFEERRYRPGLESYDAGGTDDG